jgi:hypothetical protein
MGRGGGAYCGDTIPVTWRLLNLKGEVLAEQIKAEEQAFLTIGRLQMGHGVDRGLLGIETFEVRRLEIPPPYQPSESALPFPKDEIAIVEIQRMPYKSEATPEEPNEEDYAPESDSEPPAGGETLTDDGRDGESSGTEGSRP